VKFSFPVVGKQISRWYDLHDLHNGKERGKGEIGRGRDGKEAGNYFPSGCLIVKARKRR
jgi:hypothetical protein